MTEINKKVLIIEDEVPILRAMAAKLKLVNLEPSTASNGRDGIDLLNKEEFALIVLDLMLPDIDGFTILQKIKDMGIKTPVLVVSALSQEEDKKKAMELGAEAYLTKGEISLVDLTDKIKELIS